MLSQDFSSGYEFGRVFAAFNMQPDFDKFVAARFPDAMVNNYTRLQVCVTSLVLLRVLSSSGSTLQSKGCVLV